MLKRKTTTPVAVVEEREEVEVEPAKSVPGCMKFMFVALNKV